MNRNSKQLLFFLLAAVALTLSGCSIMGDVNVYSPKGKGNAVEKTVGIEGNATADVHP
jgi:hypothetical protein